VAVLTSSQIIRVYSDGTADRLCLYAMRDVTTGDTRDLSADFTVLKQAIVLGTTTQMAFTAAISGSTVITIPAGLSQDAGWLMAWGASA
jgi:malate/lactate dehydrogenase